MNYILRFVNKTEIAVKIKKKKCFFKTQNVQFNVFKLSATALYIIMLTLGVVNN